MSADLRHYIMLTEAVQWVDTIIWDLERKIKPDPDVKKNPRQGYVTNATGYLQKINVPDPEILDRAGMSSDTKILDPIQYTINDSRIFRVVDPIFFTVDAAVYRSFDCFVKLTIGLNESALILNPWVGNINRPVNVPDWVYEIFLIPHQTFNRFLRQLVPLINEKVLDDRPDLHLDSFDADQYTVMLDTSRRQVWYGVLFHHGRRS